MHYITIRIHNIRKEYITTIIQNITREYITMRIHNITNEYIIRIHKNNKRIHNNKNT